MQGTWSNRRRIITLIVLGLSLLLLIAVDMLTKKYFVNLFLEKGNTQVIKNFFYFTYVQNKGSAFGFMSNVAWGQLFFKIFTAFSLALFIGFLVYAILKSKLLLSISLVLIVSGAIGNYVDRLLLGYVRDFIGFTFGSYNFPIFNFADTCLTIGAIIFFINFLFVDEQALFKKNGTKKDNSN